MGESTNMSGEYGRGKPVAARVDTLCLGSQQNKRVGRTRVRKTDKARLLDLHLRNIQVD